MKINNYSKRQNKLERKMNSDTNQKFSIKYLLIITISIIAFTISDIVAQEESNTEDGQSSLANQITVPVLGEHQFMQNSIVSDPFITTFISNSVGLGAALSFNSPIIVIKDSAVFGYGGDLIFGEFGLEYQQAVKDWLAMWGRLNITARLGKDTKSVLQQGVTAIIGFELGWLIKLMKTDNTMLSLSLSLDNGGVSAINVLNFINEIDSGDYSEDYSLVQNTHSLRVGSGLRFAWSISKLFGIYATGELLYGQSVGAREGSETFYNFGGVLDFDLNAVSDLPFGVLGGYKQTDLPLANDATFGNLSTLFLRIGYNKSTDFSVAVEFSLNSAPVDELDEPLKSWLASFMLRYYFD
jgi:hypothetical protein